MAEVVNVFIFMIFPYHEPSVHVFEAKRDILIKAALMALEYQFDHVTILPVEDLEFDFIKQHLKSVLSEQEQDNLNKACTNYNEKQYLESLL